MTMYIEDLIVYLGNNVKLNSYDNSVVTSFTNQIFSGRGFTEKQSLLALRILKKYTKNLEISLNKSIQAYLNNPQYRFSIRQNANNYTKKVSIVKHSTWGKAIKLEFPFDEGKVNEIRKSRDTLALAVWNSEEKTWNFSLSETNIKFVKDLTANDTFVYDEEFSNLCNQINKIIEHVENFVPMLIFDNNKFRFKNVSDFLPKIEEDNLLTSVFLARKFGIYTWDEHINHRLNEIDLHPLVKKFLDKQYEGIFEIDSSKEHIDCLKDILMHMNPCLFVIPGGTELEKTRLIYNFLTKIGFTNDEMSVMFRLPNAEGKNFNEFVKNCGLNNPITEKTKFVFVSIKLPKPVLQAKLKFNSVVSLGRSNVHYTIRDFFKNRENLIYYCEANKQKEFNFGKL